MLGKTEGSRKRGQPDMRCIYFISEVFTYRLESTGAEQRCQGKDIVDITHHRLGRVRDDLRSTHITVKSRRKIEQNLFIKGAYRVAVSCSRFPNSQNPMHIIKAN